MSDWTDLLAAVKLLKDGGFVDVGDAEEIRLEILHASHRTFHKDCLICLLLKTPWPVR